MRGFWICFWFWICQDSRYTAVLDMHETINANSNINGIMKYAKLHRVPIMTEYAWIILEYVWLCLNVTKYVWMPFVIYLPIVIPYLQAVFWKVKIWFFFYSSWKYLILFIVLGWIFLQIRFQICCYLWGLRGSGAVNLTQPMIYPINISMMPF